MKRLALLLSIILMTASFALSAGKFGFGAHGNAASLNIPDPLKSVYGAGFGGGLHVDYRFGIVSVRLNGDYTSFGADVDKTAGCDFQRGRRGEAQGLSSRISPWMEGGSTSSRSRSMANSAFRMRRSRLI